VTAKGNKLAGQSEMGGVWEWTSSPLTKHEGFEPMPLYPAYTGICIHIDVNADYLESNGPLIADFFDGKHNIILGGSWATHPRIAGRKTL
jgi:formylglycine-generating enzyme required for sulfatase activity